ncbi:pentapeptide repeat-containing protein [Streptoalloteichus hindustanus]|uniref:Pentapeptide repeat-containing protein n=1 Tax=Streptoalloteichus hindustanus TaxID=2017 RepID=A0A1M5PJP2_STRHI|nr:pentapeptide repeat-containing protein [Streptoalloteichus hindustanus]SHH02000.1 Pentapeptide repeat-containing protein [Streptoalloteichus hindustanus]
MGARQVRSWPEDPDATRALQAWLAEPRGALFADDLDFRGADLSGADLAGAWLNDSDLRGVVLTGADLTGAHLNGARLAVADLRDTTLVEAELDSADLTGASLDHADLHDASCWGAAARDVSLRSATLDHCRLERVDLRGADLTNAHVDDVTFDVWIDDNTVVRGLTGTLSGPTHVGDHDLHGDALRRWLTEHGARPTVLPDRLPRQRSSFAEGD